MLKVPKGEKKKKKIEKAYVLLAVTLIMVQHWSSIRLDCKRYSRDSQRRPMLTKHISVSSLPLGEHSSDRGAFDQNVWFQNSRLQMGKNRLQCIFPREMHALQTKATLNNAKCQWLRLQTL